MESKGASRRRGKHARQEGANGGGYYADPMSPIASTPMKRPRTKPANTKSTKAKHAANTVSRQSVVSAAATEEQHFLSPRKLVNEFDDDREDAMKENTTSKAAGRPSSKASTPTSSATKGDAAMFSPVLKVPRGAQSPTSAPTTEVRTRLDAAFSAARVDDEVADSIVAVVVHEEVQCDEGSVTSEIDAASEVGAENEFNPFVFIKSLPKYEELVPNGRTVVLPARSKHTPSICLVLDLDETLVHCTVEDIPNPHLQFPVNFNGVDYTVNVKKRPHMEYFLKQAAKQFEVVVFTASHRAYAEKLLNLLDPRRELIKYRLYREDCLDVYGNYLKDLNVLGRQLSKVVLVDNSPHAFGYQVSNGIPIETWYEDEADDELLNLLPFLESLVNESDVRPIVEKQFQIQKLIDSLPEEMIQ